MVKVSFFDYQLKKFNSYKCLKHLKKSRLHSDKHKPKIKQKLDNTKSNLPPNLQKFKQKLL